MSIIEIAIFLVSEMGIDKDAPSPHDYGKIVANLVMLRTNAPSTIWGEELWKFLAMPTEVLPPEYAFLRNTRHYELLTEALDSIYERFA